MTNLFKPDGAVIPLNEVGVPPSNEAGWTRKQDVARSFDVDVKTIERVVNSLTFDIDVHTQKGGYHNSEVLYDDYLVNAIGMKLKVNAISQGKQSEVIKRDNAQDILANSLKKNGSPEAKRALAQILLDMADQDELLQQSQQTIKALTDERDAAIAETEEIYQYNGNFHNHMYTATELGKRYNKSHFTVGRIATQLNLKQCPKYGMLGKTETSNGRWVDIFYYNDDAVAILDEYFGYSTLF